MGVANPLHLVAPDVREYDFLLQRISIFKGVANFLRRTGVLVPSSSSLLLLLSVGTDSSTAVAVTVEVTVTVDSVATVLSTTVSAVVGATKGKGWFSFEGVL